MNLDFELILVIIAGLSGGIWLLDSLFFARKRSVLASVDKPGAEADIKKTTDSKSNHYREPLMVEYARSFFPVLLVVLILRSFLFEPFRIPSGSMLPTLLVGDFILVSKSSYGVRLPVINRKILDTGKPERGDVAVFRYPKDPSLDYIKRIVGLPGDKIGYVNKKLSINGVPISLGEPKPYLAPGDTKPDGAQLRLTEKFDEVGHDILIAPYRTGVGGEITVPQGHYFVMGDNRDNSNDSRSWGFVPEENLVGKAILIWMNLDFHWSRLGSSIE